VFSQSPLDELMYFCEFSSVLCFISCSRVSIKTSSLKAFFQNMSDFISAPIKAKISVNILFWVIRATAVNLVLLQFVVFQKKPKADGNNAFLCTRLYLELSA